MHYRSLLSPSLRACRAFTTSSQRLTVPLAHQDYSIESTTTRANAKPIIFMHGLFGSKLNNRGMCKALTSQLKTPVYAIDLRNHGNSPHAPEHNYTVMADDVERFIHDWKLEKPVLIGHSMGAKTAMTLALRSPDLLSALVSVDNAPIRAPLGNDFAAYIRMMHEIERLGLTRQKEADEILQQVEPSLPIRQFLMTNLVRKQKGGALSFRIPIDTLGESLANLSDFPFTEADQVQFKGPALFVRGTKSRYVKDESIPLIRSLFPAFKLKDVDAGHWLISENPEGFKRAVVDFLEPLNN